MAGILAMTKRSPRLPEYERRPDQIDLELMQAHIGWNIKRGEGFLRDHACLQQARAGAWKCLTAAST